MKQIYGQRNEQAVHKEEARVAHDQMATSVLVSHQGNANHNYSLTSMGICEAAMRIALGAARPC